MILTVNDNDNIALSVNDNNGADLRAGDTINIGTSDYEQLQNKPSINDVEIIGDLSLSDIGVYGVTNVGYVDLSDYDDDIEEYMYQELRANGFYTFSTGEFSYRVQVEVITDENGSMILYTYWSTEEGGTNVYLLSVWFDENGEVVSTRSSSVLSIALANALYAAIGHIHQRYESGNMDVWNYCDSSNISLVNNSPILYRDTANNKYSIIETWVTTTNPVAYFQRVTPLYDTAKIYQRNGTRSGNTRVWAEWECLSNSYNDLSNKPSIPTKVSDLNNDTGFITLADLPIYNGGVR